MASALASKSRSTGSESMGGHRSTDSESTGGNMNMISCVQMAAHRVLTRASHISIPITLSLTSVHVSFLLLSHIHVCVPLRLVLATEFCTRHCYQLLYIRHQRNQTKDKQNLISNLPHFKLDKDGKTNEETTSAASQ